MVKLLVWASTTAQGQRHAIHYPSKGIKGAALYFE